MLFVICIKLILSRCATYQQFFSLGWFPTLLLSRSGCQHLNFLPWIEYQHLLKTKRALDNLLFTDSLHRRVVYLILTRSGPVPTLLANFYLILFWQNIHIIALRQKSEGFHTSVHKQWYVKDWDTARDKTEKWHRANNGTVFTHINFSHQNS